MRFIKKLRMLIFAALGASLFGIGSAQAFVVFSPAEFGEAIKRAIVDGQHATQLIKSTKAGNELLAAMGQFDPSIAEFIEESINKRKKELAEAAAEKAKKLAESVNNKWNLSGKPFVGITDSNEFVFPTPFAVYCEFDPKKLKETPGTMEDCMRKILKFKADRNHDYAKHAVELMQEAFEEEISNVISATMVRKNEAAMHEKEVIIGQREQSAKATTERDDIEVLNMSNMELLKSSGKNLLLKADAIKQDALNYFMTFDLTDIGLTEVNLLDGTKKK